MQGLYLREFVVRQLQFGFVGDRDRDKVLAPVHKLGFFGRYGAHTLLLLFREIPPSEGRLFDRIRFLFNGIAFLSDEITFLFDEITFLFNGIAFLSDEIRLLFDRIAFLSDEIRLLSDGIAFLSDEITALRPRG
jgi:hypothetical protein